MEIIRISGKLVPEFFQVHGIGHPTIHWKNADTGTHVDLDIIFDKSRIVVECKLHRFDEVQDMSTLLVNAINFAQLSINLNCLKSGDAPTIVLDRVEFPDGRVVDLYAHEKSFLGLATALESQADFSNALILAIQDPNLLLAIRDLADSIRYTNTAEINCARAVEGIRNYFDIGPDKREPGWDRMNSLLNLDPSYTKYVTSHSTKPRHGNRRAVAPDPLEIGRRAWIIMNRFFEFRKRGDQQLPLEEFPELR